ncbi:VOC family protein [Haloarchaeobius sp. DFWS5]|uniref:VOC family protein n=1 Tax=Haloarchaeobius sp. DFWS5 TaxID=3446114 RepID=UPI003EBFB3DA
MEHGVIGFDHVALPVADLDRAVSFYTDVLGLRSVDERNPSDANYHWVSVGQGQAINLAATADEESVRPGHVAFTAPESFLETVKERLDAEGIDVRDAETSLYFADPDGNELEVTCWRASRLRESGASHW